MIFNWYYRFLASRLRKTQAEVASKFPADEAERRNAALQRMIDTILDGRR